MYGYCYSLYNRLLFTLSGVDIVVSDFEKRVLDDNGVFEAKSCLAGQLNFLNDIV